MIWRSGVKLSYKTSVFNNQVFCSLSLNTNRSMKLLPLSWKLIEISTYYPDPIFVTTEWRRNSVGTIFCTECNRINAGVFPKPIDIVLTEPLEHMIGNTPSNAGAIDFFHIDFVAQIKDRLKDFVFGKCFLPDGTLIENYVTLYCKHWIFQRGNKQSKIDDFRRIE